MARSEGFEPPDHPVRSQALESAFKSINTGIIANEGSQINQSFYEFYHYF